MLLMLLRGQSTKKKKHKVLHKPEMATVPSRCRKCNRSVAPPDDASFIVLDGLRTDEAPLCSECAQGTATELRRAIVELKEENDSYAALLAAAQINEKTVRPEDDAALEAEEAALEAEVARLSLEVEKAEKSRAVALNESAAEARTSRLEGGVEAHACMEPLLSFFFLNYLVSLSDALL